MMDIRTNMAAAGARSEQELGQAWIKAITDRELDQIRELAHPKLLGRLLLPSGLTTLHSAGDMVAEYRSWFGGYSQIDLETSRVDRVGERLDVFYRLLLHDQGNAERIQQQLFFWIKDGRVHQLHLLCSGFQAAETPNESAAS